MILRHWQAPPVAAEEDGFSSRHTQLLSGGSDTVAVAEAAHSQGLDADQAGDKAETARLMITVAAHRKLAVPVGTRAYIIFEYDSNQVGLHRTR